MVEKQNYILLISQQNNVSEQDPCDLSLFLVIAFISLILYLFFFQFLDPPKYDGR